MGEFEDLALSRLTQKKDKPPGEFEQLAVQKTKPEPESGSHPLVALRNMFTGEDRLNENTKNLDGFTVSSLDPGQVAQITAGMMVTMDPQAQLDIVKNAGGEAIKVQETEHGDYIINVLDPKTFELKERGFLNKPGADTRDMLQFTSQLMQFLPAAKLTGIVGKELAKRGINTGVKTAMVAGGAGAATTSVLQDEAAGVFGSEQGVDKTKAAIAGGAGALGEAVAPAVNKLINKFRKTPKDAGLVDPKQIAKAEQAEKETGVKLLEPQATGIPSDQAAMVALQQLPGSSQKMLQALNTQNKEVGGAVVQFLDDIAPRGSSQSAAKGVRDAAKQAIDDAKAIRSQVAKPYYDKAFQNADSVDINPVIQHIDARISQFNKSVVRDALQAARKRLINVESKAPETRLEALHNAQQEIGNLISGKVKTSQAQGGGGLSGKAAGELTEIRDMLMDTLRQNKDYDQATKAFKLASPIVGNLKKRLPGRLSKITDSDLKKVAPTIFDLAESDPTAIIQAKRAISSVDPDAWNGIVRVFLEGRLQAVKRIESGNVPGKIMTAISGTPKMRNMIMRAMNKPQRTNYMWITRMLDFASRGRNLGSDTAAKQEAIKGFKSATGLSNWDLMLNPLKIPGRIGQRATDARLESKLEAIADIMINKKWSKDMAKLRRADMRLPATAKAFGTLILKAQAEQD